MSVAEEQDQRLRASQREYVGFLEEPEMEARVKEMIESKSKRLIVNINDLRRSLPDRAKNLLDNAGDEIVALQRALKEFVGTLDKNYAQVGKEFYVGYEGSFGARHVTARTLTSRHLNNLVCIEGIVTKVSLVRPKVATSVHYCPATTKSLERHYSDLTSLDAYPSTAAYPTQDEDGNPLQTEFGLSTYRDHQTLTIQELPEKAPTGQLPRAVDVICENDLVDKCKPGDRIQIVAAFRCLPGKQGGYTSGTFKTVLLANNMIQRGNEDGPTISGSDVEKCKKLSKSKKGAIFDLLSKSLAPSIHGHDYVKKALLCMLLGGVEKILPNGSRLRGDINILLIGDPSVAKSQMLRYVLSTSSRAVATTGRGSSGVGLTAAVTTDQETGERRLEAGAMVLADRGIVCIDEFDKMTDMDRTAIHEVMEQGRVTISKAGIHARLNARCSVLAAANPVYGRYDPYKSPMENIGLQDSLLSRFDLLFILLDAVDEETDRKISDHVVRVHRYRDPREVDGAVTNIFSGADDLTTFRQEKGSGEKDTPMWDDNNALFGLTRKNDKHLHIDFVRKYIEIAKVIKPALTNEACELIGEEYARLRSHDFENNDMARTQPVTARALETLIRLSTAHAKARLSKLVEREDAEMAIELVQFAYFKKVLEREKKRRHGGDEEEVDDSEQEEVEQPETEKRVVKPREPKRPRPEVTSDGESLEEEDEEMVDSRPPAASAEVKVSKEQLSKFMSALFTVFEEKRVQQIPLDEVQKQLGSKTKLNEAEIMSCIEAMTNENKIMLASDILYLI